MQYKAGNLLSILLLLCNVAFGRHLPYACVGTTEKYGVNTSNALSAIQWEIFTPTGEVATSLISKIYGRGDSIDINWKSNLLAGDYKILVTEHMPWGCTGEPAEQVVRLNSQADFEKIGELESETNGCVGQVVTLNPGEFLKYQWESGENSSTLAVATSGFKRVKLIDYSENCTFDTTQVVFHALPEVNLGPDIKFCENNPMYLDAFNTSVTEWNWSTGDISSSIELTSDMVGEVWVEVRNEFGCQNADTVKVLPCSNGNNGIPYVFTPNGDNINDTWIIGKLFNYSRVEIAVYNRWGNLVHKYCGPYSESNAWDGKDLRRYPLPMDSYHYTIKAWQLNGKIDHFRGSITIVN